MYQTSGIAGVAPIATSTPLRLVFGPTGDELAATRACEAEIFLRAYGNTAEQLQVEYAPYEDASVFLALMEAGVVVTLSAETEIPPSKADIEQGTAVIQRRLTLHVEQVLWSNPSASKPPPTSFPWLALGWTLPDGNNRRTKSAVKGLPRLELGHTYIMAIEWEPARCAPGEAPVPAQWNGLGEYSIIPYDDAIMGQGKIEGRHQSAHDLLKTLDPSDPNFSLEGAMTGKSAGDLRKALVSAHRRKAAIRLPSRSLSVRLINRSRRTRRWVRSADSSSLKDEARRDASSPNNRICRRQRAEMPM